MIGKKAYFATSFAVWIGVMDLLGNPEVSSVVAVQRSETKSVTIAYDLVHSENLVSTVTVEVTTNEEYWTLVDNVSGDVGVGVSEGTGKLIIWDAGSEWLEQLFLTVKVRVRADDGQLSDTGEPVPDGFSRIAKDSFLMGSPENELGRSADEARHGVTLSQGFLMGKTEVSWSEWTTVRNWAWANGYSDLPVGRNGLNGDESGTHPVAELTWFSTVKWLNAKSEMEGFLPCFLTEGEVYRTGVEDPICVFERDGYRLPTEAEWEYACRAGSPDAFYTGGITEVGRAPLDPNLDEGGWYFGNSDANTHPVGDPQKLENDFGLWDMHGNMAEWCWDWYGSYPGVDAIDPIGVSSGTERLLRGGGWLSEAKNCRSAQRTKIIPSILDPIVGFRMVRSIVE